MNSWCNYFITLSFFRCSADSNFLRTLNFHGTGTNPFPFMNLFDVNSLIKYDLNDNKKAAWMKLRLPKIAPYRRLPGEIAILTTSTSVSFLMAWGGARICQRHEIRFFFFVQFSATERKHQTSNKSHTVSARVLSASSPLIADYDSQTFFNNYHI